MTNKHIGISFILLGVLFFKHAFMNIKEKEEHTNAFRIRIIGAAVICMVLGVGFLTTNETFCEFLRINCSWCERCY